MSIIERLRHLAQNNRSLWRTELESELLEVADALERSGALVPVKVGEPIEYDYYNEGNVFELDGELFMDSPCLSDAVRILDGAALKVEYSETVQPVRLVAITEWEGE